MTTAEPPRVGDRVRLTDTQATGQVVAITRSKGRTNVVVRVEVLNPARATTTIDVTVPARLVERVE